jgi:hypothetical protein
MEERGNCTACISWRSLARPRLSRARLHLRPFHACTPFTAASALPLLQDKLLVPAYDGSLLRMAVELTDRLMPAFETPTGVPLSWVNLRKVRQPKQGQEEGSLLARLPEHP